MGQSDLNGGVQQLKNTLILHHHLWFVHNVKNWFISDSAASSHCRSSHHNSQAPPAADATQQTSGT